MLLQVPIMNAAILNKRKPHRRNETIAYIIYMYVQATLLSIFPWYSLV